MGKGATRGAFASFAALLIATTLAGCEPLSSAELQRETEGIASVAAEGSVLAEQIAQQDTKRTFARVQARELGESAQHSAERLSDAHPAEGLDDEVADAVVIADRIEAELGALEVAPDQPGPAAGVADRLRELSARASELAGSL